MDIIIGGEVCFASVKHGKIRIHKNTLSFLGRPEYISLIINPEDHTLGVKGSKVGDGESHYVNRKLFETKQCCELKSIGLTRAISGICPELAENKRISESEEAESETGGEVKGETA